ncbi:MAG: HEAT repeat domain-containing protein [Myxococcales bacterium]|nr:HEAT repeat domain-containing protein [Myxococcales bacterium]
MRRGKTRAIAALAACALLAGCETEADGQAVQQTAQGLVSGSAAAPAPLPRAADLVAPAPSAAPVIATTKVPSVPPSVVEAAAALDGARDNPLAGYHSLYERLPWGNADGGPWMGTGVGDPEPLKGVSDEEMLKRASSEGQTQARDDALISIARRKLPESLDVIEKAMSPSEPMGIRAGAMVALIEHGGPRALDLLWDGMNDADPFVRGKAVWGIAMHGPGEAKRAIERAMDDDAPSVMGMAILALPAVRDEAFGRDVLTKTIGHPDTLVWQEAAYILSNIDTPWARRLLADAYEASSGERRGRLRWSLQRAMQNRAGRLD